MGGGDIFCVSVLRRQEVGNDEVHVGTVLFLCVILSQKNKVMCTHYMLGMPRDKKILREPFIEGITIREMPLA
jgi:hypothetical protein